jgi:hypothetical protein
MTFERRIVRQKLQIAGRDPNDYAQELQSAVNDLIVASDEGQPPGWGDVTPATVIPDATGDSGDPTTGWAAGDHEHPIATDTTVALGAAAAEGTSSSFSRADHVHPRSVETTNGGFVRRRINFGSGFTVADDAGNNEIDVSLTVSPADALLLAWVAVSMAEEA